MTSAHDQTEPDQFALLTRALDQTGAVIGRVRETHADLPTPCRSWTVDTLVDHLIGDLDQFTISATGGSPDWSTPPPKADGDRSMALRAAAFRAGADRLLDAWRSAGDLDDRQRFTVGQQTAEFAVHAWDLATAVGSDAELDDEIAESSLAWGRTALQPQFRGDERDGKAFGPEVGVADDAPAYERLVAFFGRTPGHAASDPG